MKKWGWHPDYLIEGLIKAATAAASAATAVGLFYIRPTAVARLSEQRWIKLESAHAELEALYRKVMEHDEPRPGSSPMSPMNCARRWLSCRPRPTSPMWCARTAAAC